MKALRAVVVFLLISHQAIAERVISFSYTDDKANFVIPADLKPSPGEQVILTNPEANEHYLAYRSDTGAEGPLIRFEKIQELSLDEAKSMSNGQYSKVAKIDWKNLKEKYTGTISSAAQAGIAEGLFTGFLLKFANSPEKQEKIHQLNFLKDQQQKIADDIQNKNAEAFIKFYQAKDTILKAADYLNTDGEQFDLIDDHYPFKSVGHPSYEALRKNRIVLNSILPASNVRREQRELGLQMNTAADNEFAAGNNLEGSAYLKYAQAMADLAVGWDPITGPVRSVYEAWTGNNLITGEALGKWERGFAVLGAVTFGFGNQITKGFSFFSKIASSKSEKALATAVTWISKFNLKSQKLLPAGDYQEAFRTLEKLSEQQGRPFILLHKIAETEPHLLNHYVGLVNETSKIEIEILSRGKVIEKIPQEMSREALDAYNYLKKSGRHVVRKGNFRKTVQVAGKTQVIDGGNKINKLGHSPQYWAIDHCDVGSPLYAQKYGAYSEAKEFVEQGVIKPNAKFIVRSAPSGGYNAEVNGVNDAVITLGGGLEAVVEYNGVDTHAFFDLEIGGF